MHAAQNRTNHRTSGNRQRQSREQWCKPGEFLAEFVQRIGRSPGRADKSCGSMRTKSRRAGVAGSLRDAVRVTAATPSTAENGGFVPRCGGTSPTRLRIRSQNRDMSSTCLQPHSQLATGHTPRCDPFRFSFCSKRRRTERGCPGAEFIEIIELQSFSELFSNVPINGPGV
jgi:hypothetical protein